MNEIFLQTPNVVQTPDKNRQIVGHSIGQIAVFVGQFEKPTGAEVELSGTDDFESWEEEMKETKETTLLDQVVMTPDQPQIPWAEFNPNGTVTTDNYRQQCHCLFSQIGADMDTLKPKITNEEMAAEWLAMKGSITQALSESDTYELAVIRANWFPVWGEYLRRTVQFPDVDREVLAKKNEKDNGYAMAA